MRVANIFVAAFAAVVAAESAEAQDGSIFAAGLLYTQPNFRGSSRVLEFGSCTDLSGPIRDNIRSIRLSGNSNCIIYPQENCRGAARRHDRSEADVRDHRGRSARCVRTNGP